MFQAIDLLTSHQSMSLLYKIFMCLDMLNTAIEPEMAT